MFDGAYEGGDVDRVGVTAMTGGAEWREIDRQLRRVAKRRGELDAVELMWLARAEQAQLHRHFGHATILEYVERVLGYGPKVGKERLRVARALLELPAMAAALGEGTLVYSAVRELSRVATAATEPEWLDAARGKSLREIEDLVSGRRKGKRPTDPSEPDLALRPITLELTPPTLALFRDACRRLEDELGHRLTDDEVMAAMCATVVAPTAPTPRGVDHGRAPYQIALTVCESCDRAWHDASGRAIEVPPSTLDQARCNAQHLGRVDADEPARAEQDIPPAVQRLVHRRDRGACTVPGCRSTRWIQIHHIVARALGGTHEPSNLASVCFAHHMAHHQGKLAISGTAPDALVFERDDDDRRPDGDADPGVVALAQQALVQLGFRAPEVRAALDRARLHVEPRTLEGWIRRALQELAPDRRGG